MTVPDPTAPRRLTPRGSHDLTGWRNIDCREADLIRRQGAGLIVASSLTDTEGQYGDPVIFTEWWWRNAAGDEPVLRDYRYPSEADPAFSCTHFIAAHANAAWIEDDDD